MTVLTPQTPPPTDETDAPDRDEVQTSEAVSLLITLGVAALFALLLVWVVIVFHRYHPPEEPVAPDRPPPAANEGADGLIVPTLEP